MSLAAPPFHSLAATHRGFTFHVADPLSSIETRSLPALTRSYPRHFTFYVAHPIRSIETRSLPALTRSYPRHFTFYVAHPIRSIHYFERMPQSGNRRVHKIARQTRAKNFAHWLGF
jgi:hypothetical protein